MSFKKTFTNQQIARLMYELGSTDLYEQRIREFIEHCTDYTQLSTLENHYKEVMEFYDAPKFYKGNILYEYIRTLYRRERKRLLSESTS
jgi:hypothetical protein